MSESPLKVFIGYDPAEYAAYRVCVESMRDHSHVDLDIQPLVQSALRQQGLYHRTFYVEDGQRFDGRDERPFSTEFTFTRFLVPALCEYKGRALFVDSDFLWRAPVEELFEIPLGVRALACVHHQYAPIETRKMRSGQVQSPYPRKNWSSLILWNCASSGAKALTPYQVNMQSGRWLHGFKWVRDEEIGEIPEAWNWLEGHSSPDIEPKAVHYTRGTPDVPGFEAAPYADEWRTYYELCELSEPQDGDRRLAG